VAQEQLPPHSAMIPGRLFRTDPSITVCPAGTSIALSEPSGNW
jgi:hypothetical protein